MSYYTLDMYSGELYHFGVKGQKHGVRQYQNKDGSLTPEGYIHYGYGKRNKKTGELIIKDKYKKKLEKRQQWIDKKYDKYVENRKKKGKIVKYSKASYAEIRDNINSPKRRRENAFSYLVVGGALGAAALSMLDSADAVSRLKKNGMYYTKEYMKQQAQKKQQKVKQKPVTKKPDAKAKKHI